MSKIDPNILKQDEREFAEINEITTAGKPGDANFAVRPTIDTVNYTPPGPDRVTNKK